MAADNPGQDDQGVDDVHLAIPRQRGVEVNAMLAETPVREALPVTAEGYEQLRSELERLRTEGRRQLSDSLREVRAEGGVTDDPALFDLFEEQTQLERRIAMLEERVALAQVVVPAANGVVGIGSRVRLRDVAVGEEAEYELVGAIESDIAKGRVSVVAPVGRALVGRRAGDAVEVATPRGRLGFEILSVRPGTRAHTNARAAA